MGVSAIDTAFTSQSSLLRPFRGKAITAGSKDSAGKFRPRRMAQGAMERVLRACFSMVNTTCARIRYVLDQCQSPRIGTIRPSPSPSHRSRQAFPRRRADRTPASTLRLRRPSRARRPRPRCRRQWSSSWTRCLSCRPSHAGGRGIGAVGILALDGVSDEARQFVHCFEVSASSPSCAARRWRMLNGSCGRRVGDIGSLAAGARYDQRVPNRHGKPVGDGESDFIRQRSIRWAAGRETGNPHRDHGSDL